MVLWVWGWNFVTVVVAQPKITGPSRQILNRMAPAPNPGLTWILSALLAMPSTLGYTAVEVYNDRKRQQNP
jgi:hypothetical protein